MKRSKFTLPGVFLAVSLIAFLASSWWTFAAKSRAQQTSPPEGSLRWYVQQAAAQGADHASILTQPSFHTPLDLNDAIANSSVVVGQLSSSATSWDDATGSITTWYKFSISETLAQSAYDPCQYCDTPTVPSELLPISSGQMVVPVPGGSALIDGVVVEEILAGSSGMITGQTYLLFLNLDSSTGIGWLSYGPSGSLVVGTSGSFSPVLDLTEGQGDPISDGLVAQYSNSLNNLRSALNPTNCNASQQQECLDNGGTWNSANCTCQPAFDPCIRKPWLCE